MGRGAPSISQEGKLDHPVTQVTQLGLSASEGQCCWVLSTNLLSFCLLSPPTPPAPPLLPDPLGSLPFRQPPCSSMEPSSPSLLLSTAHGYHWVSPVHSSLSCFGVWPPGKRAGQGLCHPPRVAWGRPSPHVLPKRERPPTHLPASGQLHVVQERIGKVGLVDHEVRPLDVQDGLVLGEGSQVFVAQHLVVHLGLKGNSADGTDMLKSSPGTPALPAQFATYQEENGQPF